ncbi:hypothetical protein Tco_1264864 [Tanacetum coccineum]
MRASFLHPLSTFFSFFNTLQLLSRDLHLHSTLLGIKERVPTLTILINFDKENTWSSFVTFTCIKSLIEKLNQVFCSGSGGGGSVDFVSVVSVYARRGTSADAVRALKNLVP